MNTEATINAFLIIFKTNKIVSYTQKNNAVNALQAKLLIDQEEHYRGLLLWKQVIPK